MKTYDVVAIVLAYIGIYLRHSHTAATASVFPDISENEFPGESRDPRIAPVLPGLHPTSVDQPCATIFEHAVGKVDG